MIRADLHIHSCLSPCGSLEMGPSTVVETLKAKGITHFAVTDHNSTRNVPAFVEVALKEGLVCIPGVEVTTTEEAHILCYFDTVESALAFGEILETTLLPLPLDPDKMGDQIVVNSDEEILDMPEMYLNVASSFTIEELVKKAGEYDALVVPAHVDKPLFSIISQLGFLPPESFTAVEISAGAFRAGKLMPYGAMPTLSASDSHYTDGLGSVYVEIDTDDPVHTASELFALLQKGSFEIKLEE